MEARGRGQSRGGRQPHRRRELRIEADSSEEAAAAMAVELAKDSIDLGIMVQDIETALPFYQGLLGFEYDGIGAMDMGKRGVMHRLLCGTSLIKVRQIPAAAAGNVAAPGGINAATGMRYWTISISNMDAVVERCNAAGYRIPMGPLEFRPGVRIVMIEDPDGNWLELVENTTVTTADGSKLALTKDSIDLGIMVEEAEAAMEFYRDVLGLPADNIPEMPLPDGSVMHRLRAGTSVIKIRQHAKPPSARSAPGGSDAATGLRYWTMTVSNLAAATRRAQEAGYAVPIPVTEIRPGTSISMIEDPDGNYVELLEVAPPAPKL